MALLTFPLGLDVTDGVDGEVDHQDSHEGPDRWKALGIAGDEMEERHLYTGNTVG